MIEIGFKPRTQAQRKVKDWKRENEARHRAIWYLLWPSPLFLLHTSDPIILFSWEGSLLVIHIIFRDYYKVLLPLTCGCIVEFYLFAELQLISLLRLKILIPVWMHTSLSGPTFIVLSGLISSWQRKELWERDLMRDGQREHEITENIR